MTSPVQGTAVLNDVSILSPTLAFAVGSGGTVLKYTGPDSKVFADGFESGDTSAWTATVPSAARRSRIKRGGDPRVPDLPSVPGTDRHRSP